jgi:hypothetical protein
MIDVIKSSYCVIMKKNTTVNKLELLRRYLKFKYRISMNKEAIEARDKEWKKDYNKCQE